MSPSRVHPLQLVAIRFTPAAADDKARGLLGFVRFHIAGVEVDGVTLRKTLDGRFVLSYPARRDSWGHDHPYLRPLDDRTRKAIEHQIFVALGLEEAHT